MIKINSSNQNTNIHNQQEFCYPIIAYTLNAKDKQKTNYRKLNKFLMEIKLPNSYQNDKLFKFINVLIRNLKQLPNYQGEAFRCIDIRYTQYNEKSHNGQIICFQSFTSSSVQKGIAESFLKKQGSIFQGTTFIINSMTGKNISKFSFQSEEQILFLPFTYFHIDKIIKGQYIDVIYLTQIQTPLNFKKINEQMEKNLILWVDDNPQNNMKFISELKSYKLQFIQIIQNTHIFLWMKLFYDLLNILGMNLKVISNMVRNKLESIESQNIIKELLYFLNDNKKHQIPIPMLIFCKDQLQKTTFMQKINIKHSEFLVITQMQQDLIKFCKFQKQIKQKAQLKIPLNQIQKNT